MSFFDIYLGIEPGFTWLLLLVLFALLCLIVIFFIFNGGGGLLLAIPPYPASLLAQPRRRPNLLLVCEHIIINKFAVSNYIVSLILYQYYDRLYSLIFYVSWRRSLPDFVLRNEAHFSCLLRSQLGWPISVVCLAGRII
jgi:hypothetical protein